MREALRSFGIAAMLAVLAASAAFVAHRNASFEAAELERAREAALAAAEGQGAGPYAIAAGVVRPTEPSRAYPFLRQRELASGRVLGGLDAPETDKLLYDAAGRAEAEGSFAELLRDDSGRVLAAEVIDGGVAVAVTLPPAGPEPYPWLRIFALLLAGALISVAGARLGKVARAISIGLGASLLAAPALWWAGPWPAAVILAIAVAVAWADYSGALSRAGNELRRQRVAYTFFAPTAIAMLVLVFVPFTVGLFLGFFNHHRGEWTYVGLDNFLHILGGGGRSLADPLNFWFTLGVTVAWTAVNVALHVAIGVCLALALREPWMRCRGVFRVLLILPWAIPNYITALIWRGMFESEYGAINQLLGALGLAEVSWFSSWATAFFANVTTNTWLGFPFMMVVALGALQSIPGDLYEAAEVDGASAWQRFWHVTVPHLVPALGPAIVLGAIWTFNMFNVIYLVSEGAPGGGTDILVTEAYRWAFERGERYGLASAYATIIFLILLGWTWLVSRGARRSS
jgi:ABC-type sugar transport system permease subunit